MDNYRLKAARKRCGTKNCQWEHVKSAGRQLGHDVRREHTNAGSFRLYAYLFPFSLHYIVSRRIFGRTGVRVYLENEPRGEDS
jgi:hypothetical protein